MENVNSCNDDKNVLFKPVILYTPNNNIKDEINQESLNTVKDIVKDEIQEENIKYDNNNIGKKILSKEQIKKDMYNLKPEIIIKGNLRYIKPYEFNYQLFVKGRWVNYPLLDLLEREFSTQYSRSYFEKAIENEKILINKEKTNKNYIIRKGDFLQHLAIRKENPIINAKLEIVFEDSKYLVVNKPSSWPVHVCGGYQFNTLHRILMDEYKYKDLKILHRLDKHTSGIVVTAKNSYAAEAFRKGINEHKVRKVYYARVKGNFPHDTINVIRAIVIENTAKGVHTDCDLEEYLEKQQKIKEKYEKEIPEINNEKLNNELELKEDNIIVNEKTSKTKYKKALDGVKSIEQIRKKEEEKIEDEHTPKYAETYFEKLFYDKISNTSVVKCFPLTGRTHQIRIHLRYLGFPIANDPCYGGIIFNDLEEFDNPNMFKNEEDNLLMNNTDNSLLEKCENVSHLTVADIFAYKIWLHAFQYKFENYLFETSTPDWAKIEYTIKKVFK